MIHSPFQSAAPQLRQRGYSVIPLTLGQKYPVILGWSEFCHRLPTQEEHARWMEWKSSNIGLCLGAASGVVALDFDDDVDGLHSAIQAIVPESPVRKAGAKGFTSFFRYGGEESKGLSNGGVRVLDVLAAGKQTVLPPSTHPSGGEYRWLTPLTLADISPDELPTIPAASMQLIARLFRPEPARVGPLLQIREPYQDTTLDEIDQALSFIPADDYDLWIRMGMALRQHLGEKGMQLWDSWSAGSVKYDSSEIPKRWRSFRRNDITIATLFYTAMDYGYIATKHTDQPATLVIEPGGNLMPVTVTVEPTPQADLLNPPGLVGRIARWINETSIYPQPMLAVAAAITVAGIAMAHKVQSPTRLRTNFYTMGLAPSGAGKDHARDCATMLLCRAGMEGLVGGTPASGAGMLTALREGQGRCLILWDEFGRVLKNLTHKNAGSHQRDILTYLVELFSSAKSMYAGVQYANHDGKMKRTPIDQPCLSVYATTVPERFFQTLTSDDAIDGFLARWLVLESKEYTLKPVATQADINDPPEDLLAELRRWREAPSNYNPKGNIDGIIRICPMTVSYSAEAEMLITCYAEQMRKRASDESQKRSGLGAIFARSAEHAIKLALVSHEGEVIGIEAMRWAIGVADHCSAYLVEAVKGNVAVNDFERASKKVHAIVAESRGDWVRHGVLVRRTQDLGVKIRHEIISNLAEAGLIEVRDIKHGGAGRPSHEYRAVG